MKKNISLWSLLFVGALVLGILLLVLSALLPNEPVRKHALESTSLFAMSDNMLGVRNDSRYVRQDHFTDALMAEVAMTIDKDRPYQSVMLCNFPFSGDPVGDLQQQANGAGADIPIRDYARYWHGYLVWVRPILAYANWSAVRGITLAMLSLVVLLCVALWANKKGVVYAVGACAPILLCYFPQAGISPQHASVYFVGLIASIILLSVPRICDDLRWAGGVMLLAGCASSYVDLLSAPMIGLLLPLLTYCMVAKQDKQFYQTIVILLVLWFVGYFGFWFMKWVIGSLTTDLNVIKDGFHNASVRSYGCDDDFYNWGTIFDRLGELLREPFMWLPLGVAGLIWICTIKPKQILPNLYLLVLALVPVVWMFFMRQHSAIHFHHLAWRNMIPSMIAVFLFVIKSSRMSSPSQSR